MRNARRVHRGSLAIIFALLAACRAGETATTPVKPEAASGIVFASDRSGVYQIWTMDADGGSPRRLTDSDDEARHPRVSPDGRRIVFEVVDAKGRHIDVMDIDGSNRRRLEAAGPGDEPSWSPDGERIVFSSERDGRRALWVANADGTAPRKIGPAGVLARSPAWSPDGLEIAFSGVIDGREEVFVMNADGTNVRRLTRRPGEDSRPAWLPDGKRLVINTTRMSRNDDLELIGVDGRTVRLLTDRKKLAADHIDRNIANWGARVSPDGRRILFTSIRDGNAELWSMDLAGGSTRRLTDDDGHDDMGDWIPRR